MKHLPVAIAQLNFTVGDVGRNVDKMLAACNKARTELACKVVVFPELAVTGYPPEDLLFRSDFLDRADRGLARLLVGAGDICVVVGHPFREDGKLYNAASVIESGQVRARYFKQKLPNYGVFDEKRYFSPGTDTLVIDIDGFTVGLTVCEDVWYQRPVADCVAAGAEVIFNLNASPFDVHKAREREEQVVAGRSREVAVPIVYVNLVGGQDELVFDGGSFACDATGQVVHRSAFFSEDLARIDIHQGDLCSNRELALLPGHEESVYEALQIGLRDYVTKNGFDGVVLGLSGGIDSALTLAVAADALGPDKVQAVLMPSRYTRDMSLADAKAQAQALGVTYQVIPIESLVEAYRTQLEPLFRGLPADTTEENLQARIRGNLLMAISNKTGCLVLTTGNKSEMAVGYATLYGDMAGGFAVIKDVPKTLVYQLARYRNRSSVVIPERVITRPPSAELAEDQADTDSLPPYEVLDPILEDFIEHDCSIEEIAAKGFEVQTVSRVSQMVLRNEYKRRQAPPGVRITRRAFGRDRRYPITSGFS